MGKNIPANFQMLPDRKKVRAGKKEDRLGAGKCRGVKRRLGLPWRDENGSRGDENAAGSRGGDVAVYGKMRPTGVPPGANFRGEIAENA